MKVLNAVATGKWVLSPKWLLDSYEQKKFLPEYKYGFRRNELPLQYRKVFNLLKTILT